MLTCQIVESLLQQLFLPDYGQHFLINFFCILNHLLHKWSKTFVHWVVKLLYQTIIQKMHAFVEQGLFIDEVGEFVLLGQVSIFFQF